jgi:hypothetical protein
MSIKIITIKFILFSSSGEQITKKKPTLGLSVALLHLERSWTEEPKRVKSLVSFVTFPSQERYGANFQNEVILLNSNDG